MQITIETNEIWNLDGAKKLINRATRHMESSEIESIKVSE